MAVKKSCIKRWMALVMAMLILFNGMPAGAEELTTREIYEDSQDAEVSEETAEESDQSANGENGGSTDSESDAPAALELDESITVGVRSPQADKSNVTVTVPVDRASTNNVLEVYLPRHISLAAEWEPGEQYITDFSQEVQSDGRTKLTFQIDDGANLGADHIGPNFQIDQTKFFSRSEYSKYEIEVVYTYMLNGIQGEKTRKVTINSKTYKNWQTASLSLTPSAQFLLPGEEKTLRLSARINSQAEPEYYTDNPYAVMKFTLPEELVYSGNDEQITYDTATRELTWTFDVTKEQNNSGNFTKDISVKSNETLHQELSDKHYAGEAAVGRISRTVQVNLGFKDETSITRNTSFYIYLCTPMLLLKAGSYDSTASPQMVYSYTYDTILRNNFSIKSRYGYWVQGGVHHNSGYFSWSHGIAWGEYSDISFEITLKDLAEDAVFEWDGKEYEEGDVWTWNPTSDDLKNGLFPAELPITPDKNEDMTLALLDFKVSFTYKGRSVAYNLQTVEYRQTATEYKYTFMPYALKSADSNYVPADPGDKDVMLARISMYGMRYSYLGNYYTYSAHPTRTVSGTFRTEWNFEMRKSNTTAIYPGGAYVRKVDFDTTLFDKVYGEGNWTLYYRTNSSGDTDQEISSGTKAISVGKDEYITQVSVVASQMKKTQTFTEDEKKISIITVFGDVSTQYENGDAVEHATYFMNSCNSYMNGTLVYDNWWKSYELSQDPRYKVTESGKNGSSKGLAGMDICIDFNFTVNGNLVNESMEKTVLGNRLTFANKTGRMSAEAAQVQKMAVGPNMGGVKIHYWDSNGFEYIYDIPQEGTDGWVNLPGLIGDNYLTEWQFEAVGSPGETKNFWYSIQVPANGANAILKDYPSSYISWKLSGWIVQSDTQDTNPNAVATLSQSNDSFTLWQPWIYYNEKRNTAEITGGNAIGDTLTVSSNTSLDIRRAGNYNSINTYNMAYSSNNPVLKGKYHEGTVTEESLDGIYVVDNPTYYIVLQEGYNYVPGSFQMKNGKKPQVTTSGLLYNNRMYTVLKIQFYESGDPATSFRIPMLYVMDSVNHADDFDISYSFEVKSTYLVPVGEHEVLFASSTSSTHAYYGSYLLYEDRMPNNISDYEVLDLQDKTAYGKLYLDRNVTYSDYNGAGGGGKFPSKNLSAITAFSPRAYLYHGGMFADEATVKGGEVFQYQAQLRNDIGDSVEQIVMYIPLKNSALPKSEEIGRPVEPYEWDMELQEKVSLSGFTVYYSTAENPTMNEYGAWNEQKNHTENGVYKTALSGTESFADVTMIKLVSDKVEDGNRSVATLTLASGEKKEPGDLTDYLHVYSSYAVGGRTTSKAVSDPSKIILTDNGVSGRLWLDEDRDGLMDDTETENPLDKLDKNDVIKVSLYRDKGEDGRELLGEKTFKRGDTDLTYSFEASYLQQGDYLEITLPGYGWMLTETFAAGGIPSIQSHFSQADSRAVLTPGSTSGINAGLIYTSVEADAVVTIPSSVILTEEGTNLGEGYVGNMISILFDQVAGAGLQALIEVNEGFDITSETGDSLRVKSYNKEGKQYTDDDSDGYAELGVLNEQDAQLDIWFNTTEGQLGESYKGTANFEVSIDRSENAKD